MHVDSFHIFANIKCELLQKSFMQLNFGKGFLPRFHPIIKIIELPALFKIKPSMVRTLNTYFDVIFI